MKLLRDLCKHLIALILRLTMESRSRELVWLALHGTMTTSEFGRAMRVLPEFMSAARDVAQKLSRDLSQERDALMVSFQQARRERNALAAVLKACPLPAMIDNTEKFMADPLLVLSWRSSQYHDWYEAARGDIETAAKIMEQHDKAVIAAAAIDCERRLAAENVKRCKCAETQET